MLEKQFEELKLTGNLPSPSGVGLAILQATQREDVTLDEVVRILQADPTLTGRILKLANSTAHAGAQRAGSVREAAVRLGLRTVRNVSLGFSLLASNRAGRCKAFDYDGYWSHSLATAAASQAIARLRGHADPSEAFTLGLLSGIGRLALASVHPAAYGQILDLAQGASSQRLAEIEQECLGTNHRELAAALLSEWHLPRSFSVVVGLVGSGQHAQELGDPNAVHLAQTLQGARDLARALTTPFDASPATCRQRLVELKGLREHLELESKQLQTLWEEVVESWREWGDTMRVRAHLQMSIGDLRAAAQRKDVERASASPDERELGGAELAVVDVDDEERGLRVLLAVGGSDTMRTLARNLEGDGHQVLTARDGQQALALALEQAPHVLVTEWSLPGLSGPELVHTLRRSALGERVHAILLIEAMEQERVLHAFQRGVDEYLVLPCDPKILQARVHAEQRVVRINDHRQALLRERENQISQLAVAKRRLYAATITDALTGLKNRRYAMERMQGEIASCERNGTPLSVMMIDIDKFKAVNDNHGHDVGDIVLRETAKLLQDNLRGVDVVCRMGGEEFLVICPGTALADAVRVADRLCGAAREHEIRAPGFSRPVTISIGVAQLEPGCHDVDTLIKRADERVYLAKEGGRDRAVAAAPRPAPQARRQAS